MGSIGPYALAQLCEDPHHAPLPKNKPLGVLLQGKAQETFCGQISQFQVHQLLAASPHIVYPIGLNGHDEPIITTLPDVLGSGTSLIASEHIYLEIDFPSPTREEPDQKMLPLEDIPTILITSPPNLKAVWLCRSVISYPQAVLEASSCESQQSLPRRVTTTVVLMSLPQRPEGLPLPADTSSQASIDKGEASLEDIPTNISPIAAISGSDSTSTSMDLAEFWTNANKALNNLLSTKGSIDARRWRAVWDLGMKLCQNGISSSHNSHRSQNHLLPDGPRHLDSLLPVDPWGQDWLLGSS